MFSYFKKKRLLINTTRALLFALVCAHLPILIFDWDSDLLIFHIPSYCLILFVFLCTTTTINTFLSFPGNRTNFLIIPSIGIWLAFSIMIILFFRLNYSSSYISLGLIFVIVFSYLDFFIRQKQIHTIAYIPLDNTFDHLYFSQINWLILDHPILPNKKIHNLIVNLHSPNFSDDWQKFVAECTLKGIRVFNTKQVKESLTGRVELRHLSENDLGTLYPSDVYMLLKRFCDIFLVLITFPLTLTIMLIVAILIKLESPGPALFKQKRVGQFGKEFTIYKFRSMSIDSEKYGAKFATQNDERITSIGYFIRKTRIDELPQFFNILLGDMSLIGPRPEQKNFVEQFEKEIPFFNYRHIVKPGISGWAQITQGYTASTEETRIKTEYDFYYIKNFSLSLDIYIFIKTFKTIFTGFGAR